MKYCKYDVRIPKNNLFLSCFPIQQKLKEFVDKGMETIGTVAKKVGSTAKYSANVIGNSRIAQGAAAAGTEAAR
jgi:hypothetical protein